MPIYPVDTSTSVSVIGENITKESHLKAVRAAEINVIKKLNEALEKREWCPCCGYDGLWPRGSDGEREWSEFLASTFPALGQPPRGHC
jgi:hypothetical protein